MAQGTLRRCGDVTLLDPMELDDDDIVVPSAMMGAPTVMVEKIPRGEEIVTAFKALADLSRHNPCGPRCRVRRAGSTRRRPSRWPPSSAFPLVDADMMGRAFPELQMCTPTLYGVTATPMAIADEKGNSAVINTINNRWTETLARTLDDRHGLLGDDRHLPDDRQAGQRDVRAQHDLLAGADRQDHSRARASGTPTLSMQCARQRTAI